MHHRWPLIFPMLVVWAIVALIAHGSPQKQRKLHRLVGGHLKIVSPEESDDAEFMFTASAGEAKDKKSSGKEEDKKTLSQQVAEGKYGLIQKELFKKPPKRPGILSYETNPEVPKDNINTLGGLSKNEIWLAENHLLVIRGGTYPPHDDVKDYPGSIWQPIDDYSAPLHQVKIPKNPRVPPPFPVQFADDGPLQILGTNFTRTLNGSAEAEAYALPPPGLGWQDSNEESEGYETTQGSSDTDPAHPVAGQVAVRIPGEGGSEQDRQKQRPHSGEYNGGLPLPPSLASNGTWPAFFESLPPGAVIITPPPPNENGTEVPFDEDDPSIYYPPPYSFYYPKDNSSVVPPGPLVPGIVLPPPPNFFAQLEDITTQTPTTTTIITTTIITQKPPRKKPSYKEHSTSNVNKNTIRNNVVKITTIHPKYSTVSSVRFVETRRNRTRTKTPYRGTPMTTKLLTTTRKPAVEVISTINIGTKPLNRTYLPQKPTKLKPTVTILRPVKPNTSTPKVVIYNNAQDIQNQNTRDENTRTTAGNSGNSNNLQEEVKSPVQFNENQPYDTYMPPNNNEDNRNRPFESYGPPKENPYGPLPIHNEVYDPPVRLKPVISTSRVPLRFYTSGNIDENVVTEGPEKGAIEVNSYIPKTTPKSPAQYYFFEEQPEQPVVTTQKPQIITSSYFEAKKPYYSNLQTTEKPVAYYPNVQNTEKPENVYYPSTLTTEKPNLYYSSGQSTGQSQPYYTSTTEKSKFVYVNSRPTQKPRFRLVQQPPRLNTFSVHIAKLQNELHQYYTTPKANRHRVRPVYQYSFEATNIKRPNAKFKPSPQIHVPAEDFKPIPYNVHIQPAVEIIHSSTQSSSTELNKNNQYFSTPRPSFYDHQSEFVVTPSKPVLEYAYDATPNPLKQGYYTKPDEGFFDENTRQYFTMFGRKLPSSTTALPPLRNLPQQRPISLENDINVNYIKPRPTVEPMSEPFDHQNKPEIVKAIEWRPKLPESYQNRPYDSKPPDIVKAIEYRPSIHQERTRDGSYISYELPGDSGAHFYFLTPQLATQKNQVFYEQTNNRLRRKPNNES